ncbi:MAG: hypothetical protein KDF65_03400 [Anaerolineae bacterium]|nr:hypothetical protein [Anaerolineae bacterium]
MINEITTSTEYVELTVEKTVLSFMVGRILVDLVAGACRSRQTNKVLVYTQQVVNSGDVKDTLRLCSYLIGRLTGTKIALVYQENRSGDLLDMVEADVQRYGVDLKFFQDKQAAILWLYFLDTSPSFGNN